MIKKIFYKILPENVEKDLRLKLFRKKLKQIIKQRLLYDKLIYFISTPEHGNLGDQAIVYSQYHFFKRTGLSERIIEISHYEYKHFKEIIKENIRSSDLIVIDGGGSMGTLWLEVEYQIQDIVKNLPENKIIIFPQTVYYATDENAQTILENSKCIYNNHPNLLICAREEKSYNFLKENYTEAKVLLTPDIVLNLDGQDFGIKREHIILCLRNDKEKTLSKSGNTLLMNFIKSKNVSIKSEPTVVKKFINKNNRQKELQKKWKAFSSGKVVITDRLHGMIFAAITGTPCIAFDNSSNKVKNVYKWIENSGYIFFYEENELNLVLEKIDSILKEEEKYTYSNSEIVQSFGNLYKEIDKMLQAK